MTIFIKILEPRRLNTTYIGPIGFWKSPFQKQEKNVESLCKN